MSDKETLDVLNSKEREGKDNFIRSVGVAWVNKDKKSINVKLYGDASNRQFLIRHRTKKEEEHKPILEGVATGTSLEVISFVDTTKNKVIMNVELAKVNRDGSVGGFYDIFPKNAEFQVKVKKEKVEEMVKLKPIE